MMGIEMAILTVSMAYGMVYDTTSRSYGHGRILTSPSLRSGFPGQMLC